MFLLIEVTTTQAVIGVVGTLLGGGAVSAIVSAFLARRKNSIELAPAESAGMDNLLGKIRSLMGEKLEDFRTIQNLSTELAGQKVLIEVAEKEVARIGEMLKQVLVEQGRAEEREKQCQTRLADVMERLEEYGDLHNINRRLTQDLLRTQAELDERDRASTIGGATDGAVTTIEG